MKNTAIILLVLAIIAAAKATKNENTETESNNNKADNAADDTENTTESTSNADTTTLSQNDTSSTAQNSDDNTSTTQSQDDTTSATQSQEDTSIATQGATLAPLDTYVWLVVATNKTAPEIETELESQFDQLFANYCSDATQDVDTCNAYLNTTVVARAAHRASTSCYDVIIKAFVETNRCSDCKEMLVAVNFLCGSGSGSTPVPIPSTILASYFNETSTSYESLQIVSSQAASDIKDTFTTTTAKQPEAQTVTIIDEGFMIATIVLGVLLGAALLILVGLLLYNHHSSKQKDIELGTMELQLTGKSTIHSDFKIQKSHAFAVETSARPAETDYYDNEVARL